MHFSEEEEMEVKKWVVKKLEDISDADSDVLADYVLALIRSDAPDDEIRKASVENLEDFLREHTNSFVDELFSTFGPQKQAPPAVSHEQQLPQGIPAQQPLPFDAPSGPAGAPYSSPMDAYQQDGANYNRKRSYNEGFQDQEQQEDVPYNRTFKAPRRGREGGRGDWMGRDNRQPPSQFPQTPVGGFPTMPPAFPGFDQNDPMAAMMALQSMGFPQMPGMPPMPMAPGAPGQQQQVPKSSERCPFYETQGICYLGSTCPYQHDVIPSREDEYDPKSSNIMMDAPRHGPDGAMRGSDRGRGRGRGDRGGFGGRGRRSEFSSAGPNEDTTVATIVVEQIPDDKLNEESVREFFAQFGEIVEVSLQPHRKLALITYDNHASAKRAWSSPKVIFDNRFVKVYWYRPKPERNNDHRAPGEAAEGPAFDPEEFQRQQEEAQKAHDEKMQKRKETEEAKHALEQQRDELLKKQQEEKDRLLQRLKEKGVGNATGAEESQDEPMADENASEQTKQLRAQLASLEAEAKTLGIDPSQAETSFGYRGRGRGFPGFRARGGFPPRGRGFDPSYRGGYRGRGAFRGRGGGVLRLDNRPRRVAVSGIDNSEKDEAFRQYLIGLGEYESVEPNPEQPNTLIVTFKERYQAEKLMFSPWTIPSVGEVQLSWLPNLPQTAPSSTPATPGQELDAAKAAFDDDTNAMAMDTTMTSEPEQRKDGGHDVDYDVAEVDDNWDVE